MWAYVCIHVHSIHTHSTSAYNTQWAREYFSLSHGVLSSICMCMNVCMYCKKKCLYAYRKRVCSSWNPFFVFLFFNILSGQKGIFHFASFLQANLKPTPYFFSLSFAYTFFYVVLLFGISPFYVRLSVLAWITIYQQIYLKLFKRKREKKNTKTTHIYTLNGIRPNHFLRIGYF